MMTAPTVKLGDKEYEIPSLCLDDYERLAAGLEEMKGKSDREAFKVMREVIGAAMANSYPGFDVASLGKLLTIRNVIPIFHEVMRWNGFEAGKSGEAPSP